MSFKDKEYAVVGAGISGLAAARFLAKAGLKVDVFEVSSNDRFGRIYTHRFPKHSDTNEYQYGELGAMRLPSNHRMVLKLIAELNDENKHDPENEINLLPFEFDNNNAYFQFNNKRILRSEYRGSEDLGFEFEKKLEKAEDILTGYLLPFIKILKTCPKTGLDLLVKLFDYHSVRSYLLNVGASNEEIHYIEAVVGTTGFLEIGLIEAIIDHTTFSPSEPIRWNTIDKGMERLPKAMVPLIKEKIHYNTEVIGVEDDKEGKIHLKFKGKENNNSKGYDGVIISVPFGVLRFWDTSNWSIGKRRAIEELSYEFSSKILLQYDNNFWLKEHQGKVGGYSSTDLPVRTVVYPSFPKNQVVNKPAVLLASYSHNMDSQRLSGLKEQDAVQVATHNIQLLFKNNDQPIDSKVHHWGISNHSIGAFASYRPRQFAELYKAASKKENNGKVFFCGEHLSIYHGWIEGSLASSLSAVYDMLAGSSERQEIFRHWGVVYHKFDV